MYLRIYTYMHTLLFDALHTYVHAQMLVSVYSLYSSLVSLAVDVNAVGAEGMVSHCDLCYSK